MKIGVLFCAYNSSDTLDKCLRPWLSLKNELGFVISTVSIPFEEYKDFGIEEDNTRILLENYLEQKDIDFLHTEPKWISEAKARDLALQSLLSSEVDTVILLDADEIYTVKQIRAIFKFWEKTTDICWASVHFRNYVFDENTWVDGFCPPRLFRANCGNLKLSHCYYDNDLMYVRDDKVEFDYKNLPKAVVPKSIAHVRHLSWLGEKAKQKVQYQNSRKGWVCSYSWDEKNDKLIFNKEYYEKTGQRIPELNKDE